MSQQVGTFEPLCKPWNSQHIGSIEANFFPSLFSKWMERLAVSRTEATCPGANFRFLPQLLIYKIELSWNTNKDRLRPAKSIHMPSRKSNTPGMATKAVTSGAKGGVPAR